MTVFLQSQVFVFQGVVNAKVVLINRALVLIILLFNYFLAKNCLLNSQQLAFQNLTILKADLLRFLKKTLPTYLTNKCLYFVMPECK